MTETGPEEIQMFFRGRSEGTITERERIAKRIKAHICFDALADSDGRCRNHSGKCYELGLLVLELMNERTKR